ncbi:MAG: PspC domain-containing protein [Terriglobales bacterium]
MDSATLYCNACGTAISNLSRYCSNCGRAVAHPQCTPKLVRSRVNRKIAGVCAGLAEHLDLDTSLVRILWVFLTFASGCFPGVVAYVLAWIIIPEEPVVSPVVVQPPHTVAG